MKTSATVEQGEGYLCRQCVLWYPSNAGLFNYTSSMLPISLTLNHSFEALQINEGSLLQVPEEFDFVKLDMLPLKFSKVLGRIVCVSRAFVFRLPSEEEKEFFLIFLFFSKTAFEEGEVR